MILYIRLYRVTCINYGRRSKPRVGNWLPVFNPTRVRFLTGPSWVIIPRQIDSWEEIMTVKSYFSGVTMLVHRPFAYRIRWQRPVRFISEDTGKEWRKIRLDVHMYTRNIIYVERDKGRRIIIQIKKHLDDFYEIVFYQDQHFFPHSIVNAFSKNPIQ